MKPTKITRYEVISDTDEVFEYKTMKKALRAFQHFTQTNLTVSLVKTIQNPCLGTLHKIPLLTEDEQGVAMYANIKTNHLTKNGIL